MPAGHLEDADLRYLLTLLGSSAQDAAIKAKIEADLPAPVVHSLQLVVVGEGTEVEVSDAPEGKTVDFALCADEHGASPLYEPKGQKVGAKVKGKPGHEWIDAHVTGASEWWSKAHGRIHVGTTQPPPPPPEEEKQPPPPPPLTGSIRVGCAAGGTWGPQELVDFKAGGHNAVRRENPSSITADNAAGLDVLWLANIYNTGGFRAVSRTALMERVRKAAAAGAWVIEVGNEPGGDWFFGTGALSEANAKAYGEALLEAHAAAPNHRILASWDGGHAGGEEWGKLVLKTTPQLKGQKWLIWSVHCYAGSGANPAATKLNPPSGLCQHLTAIDKCHAATECDVIPSELGFPTISGTGDSPKCTEAQQKLGHELSLVYCRERPYVKGYFAYGYRDGNGAKGYGLVRSDDSKKPAWAVVHP